MQTTTIQFIRHDLMGELTFDRAESWDDAVKKDAAALVDLLIAHGHVQTRGAMSKHLIGRVHVDVGQLPNGIWQVTHFAGARVVALTDVNLD